MPLTLMRVGDTACVTRVTGKDHVRSRLAELGFTPGSEMKMVAKRGDDVIVSIKESRIALNRDMASRIMI
ncbi:MAG: ferrous iron transport protein A [Clostridiales Family XIII bacterium]|jgi:ferrous iron transport protein A|nr:ferrous iron transport protein A [Clostridiales Family XIII bacterium]